MLNTVLPAIAEMRAATARGGRHRRADRCHRLDRRAGPVPGSAAYCAAKAAADAWTVATAPAARAQGMHTDQRLPGLHPHRDDGNNQFPMPGLMDADRAARIILRAVTAGRVRVAFPWWMAAAAHFAALLPPRLVGALTAGRQGKPPGSDAVIVTPNVA